MARIFVSGALCLGMVISVASGQNCAEDKVRKCISIAEPMLKDPHLIFPDNMNDINSVCRTWSNFVECIRRYIDKCFSKVRKDQFNSAVEPPISSVHQMCSVSSYQSEYLKYAGCIKSTVIEPEHCGGHYTFLVGEVSLENVRKPNLCCAYHNFRTCVITKTRLRCDGNQPEGIAARFSRQVLDKAFRFLQDQCLNYIPDTGKCTSMMTSNSSPGAMSISRLGEGRSVTLESPNRTTGSQRPSSGSSSSSSSSSSNGSGKTPLIDGLRSTGRDHYDPGTNAAQSPPFETGAGRAPSHPSNPEAPPPVGGRSSTGTSGPTLYTLHAVVAAAAAAAETKTDAAAAAAAPPARTRPDDAAARKPEPTLGPPIVHSSVPVATGTQRSSSYGRGISWTTPTTPSTSEIPDWATNTWLTHSQDLPTEEIYPAAGSFGGNNIDEPNQQGLSRNGNPRTTTISASVQCICAFQLLIQIIKSFVSRY